ncbi:hypothetical protein KJ819_01920 [Patescibacteria group bacterium]|nr:hypothetical protein [Patescibacteria group bacterium]MBU1500959.1 hypothetical protein [Patescibacteria group bacterium]MBU2080589.1 hypothetical protein [Patescibacteria group bacterium]MBU2124335.1 hypothetical protein [Patescibacteria group bacterium]MBU2194461.1 hypothetical protein [Patescibacteria group bacterium]
MSKNGWICAGSFVVAIVLMNLSVNSGDKERAGWFFIASLVFFVIAFITLYKPSDASPQKILPPFTNGQA